MNGAETQETLADSEINRKTWLAGRKTDYIRSSWDLQDARLECLHLLRTVTPLLLRQNSPHDCSFERCNACNAIHLILC